MKRKLLFAALCVVGALGTLRAQTDVTSTYITNPSFESDGAITASNGALTMTGWTQSDPTSSWNNTGCYDASTNLPTQGTVSVTPSDGDYLLFFRKGWAQNTYTFTTSEAKELPAGSYTLSVDYKMVEGYDNTQNNNTKVIISAKNGDTVLGTATGTTKTNVSGGSAYTYLNTADWSTVTANFSIEEATSTTFVIALQVGGQRRSDFVIDNVRLLHTPFIVPTAITLNESSLDMKLTQTTALSVSAYTPDNANYKTGITWTTSDANVATVSDAGVVTAVATGSATITATTENSVTATCTVTVTDVTPVAAPANYSEIAAGDFYIVNAATGKYLGGANSWGTQASQIEHGIPFTVAISDGKYTLDSHTYNNSTDHFFSGTYVDGGTTNLYVTSLGSGKYAISTADGSAFVTANVNNTTVANTADNSNSTLAQWYFVSKADRDALFASATNAGPADATYYLTEANISRNLRKAYNTSGWTGTFSYGGWNENQCAERYCANTDVYQTVTVPNGKYTVKCQGFYRRQSAENTSYLYANDVEVALNRIEFGGINSMDGASEAFSNGEYWNTLTVYVTDGSLKVGIKCDATTNWTIWDNFEIYYHGPTIAGEATEIAMDSETPMTAGKWYYFDIPVTGLYNLNTTTISDIVYTTDGTILIENEGDVTATFSTGVNENLTAGRYFVKSASAQNLEVTVGAYAYEVGSATLSTADGSYTQNSTFTVTFPDAATSDPSGEVALVASSTATVNGNTVDLVAVTNGFRLDLGSLTENTDYVIAIPAGVYGYAGESMNEAINVTIHTPVVFDGEYVLFDATSELFLGRGNEYGTEASVDKYGIPFNLVTDATGSSSIEFVDWTGVYLFITGTSIYTDNASTGWTLNPVVGGYTLSNVGKTLYATHSAGTYGEYVHTTAEAASATVWTLLTKAERDAIIAAYPAENKSNVITASGISTTAGDFETFLSNNYNEVDYTSAIGTATFAGAAGDWTWNPTLRKQDGQPAYGTNFVEAWNATGAWTQTVDKANLPAGIYKVTVQGYERRKANDAATALYAAGYNLVSTFLSANGEQVRFTDWNEVDGKPTNTGGAVTAFEAGEAVNTVYVYLDGDTDLNLTVRKPNYIWDCWVIMNNFTLTRYEQAEATMVITDAKYATFVAPFDVVIPSGVTAYTVTGRSGNTLVMDEVTTTISANTPVILYKETALSATTFYGKSVDGTPSYGLLTGVYANTPAPNGSYVLQNNDSKIGFYLVNTEVAQPTVGANRCYLTVPAGVKANAFFFNEATGIQNVLENLQAGEIYDISGRKLGKLQKGVNIVNGKKVLVK